MKCFFLTLISLIGVQLCASDKWSAGLYLSHTIESFDQFAPAHERINMKNIDYPLLHAAVLFETNRVRRQHNVSQFRHSESLEQAAKAHSDDMVRFHFFSHVSPVKGKKNLKDRIAAVGVGNCAMAENIAETFGIDYKPGEPLYTPNQNGGYFSYSYRGEPIAPHTYISLAKAVVTQWMQSPGHRMNILNSNYSFLGVGAAHLTDEKFYNMDRFRITQCFSSADAHPPAKKH